MDAFDEWLEMPEFIQKNKNSYRKISVHFRNEKDVQLFAELLNLYITPKMKSVWFPAEPNQKNKGLAYYDES